MNYRNSLLALSLLLPLAACGDTTQEDPGEHACEQVEVAGTAITAGDSVDTAAELTVSEEPYTVTLVDGGESFLKIVVEEDTAALLFVDQTDVVADICLDGTSQGLDTAGANEFCSDEIPAHWHLDLEPGTWTIKLNDVAVDTLWMLLMPGEGHEHEE